ncbi:hypothetical protein NDU88_008334 [Pleurodeles waltl]|uniref:Uncharacterized protein n=1 Tax=Pleurodeles waltl TaxID=8319 RepID=A0AAV7PPF5_PLEWA|nr:hypothetical protein NDU88_008334 [Pleurodeles waltl]
MHPSFAHRTSAYTTHHCLTRESETVHQRYIFKKKQCKNTVTLFAAEQARNCDWRRTPSPNASSCWLAVLKFFMYTGRGRQDGQPAALEECSRSRIRHPLRSCRPGPLQTRQTGPGAPWSGGEDDESTCNR